MVVRNLIVAVVALVGLFIFGAIAPVDAQNTENFTIRSFTADYYLTRDDANRSQLKVTEQIVAVFPDFDQNHGILRAIPKVYDDHTVNLDIQGVTDQNGQPWQYTTSSSNDNQVLKIGDPDAYVHGEQVYNIEYSLNDVTRNFDGYDEFFWDTNGTRWGQRFDKVTARIHLDPAISERFNSQTRCYTGVQGSTESACTISTEGDSIIIHAGRSLGPGENMSVVLGFEPDTFAPYQPDPWQLAALAAMALVGLLIPVTAFTVMWRKWHVHGRDPAGRGTIVPEYTPPENMNPLLADIIINERTETKAISATALDLCIRRYLKLYQTSTGKLLKKTEYELELVQDPSSLTNLETKALEVFFGSSPKVGDRVNLTKQKNKLYSRVAPLQKAAYATVSKQGYFTTNPTDARKKYLWWGIGFIIVGFGLTFAFLPGMLVTFGLIVAGAIILIFSGIMPARTARGVVAKEHLLGLKDYMTIAERERIKILQSPKGAQKITIDPNDKSQLIKLYEKLLPYAMLFGIEKDWAKQFADLYEQPPDWYNGSRSFNAGVFAGAISGFNTASSGSFTAPSSSSSSGFSGGGSGGGGGGGGGGGW